MTTALTDGQLHFLLTSPLDHEEYDIRSGESELALREFAERVK